MGAESGLSRTDADFLHACTSYVSQDEDDDGNVRDAGNASRYAFQDVVSRPA
jgi:hypothetical protein